MPVIPRLPASRRRSAASKLSAFHGIIQDQREYKGSPTFIKEHDAVASELCILL